MLRFLTAGESHGKALNVIIEGLPSNLTIEADDINRELARRQLGYGRGGRMQIEKDRVDILSGIRYGKTLGSPLAVMVVNKDWKNWTEKMSIEDIDDKTDPLTVPRPGHADMNGYLKYNYNDIRNVIERSSARETTVRTAAGAAAKALLRHFGITIGSYVEAMAGIRSENVFIQQLFENKIGSDFSAEVINEEADKSELRMLDKEQEERTKKRIDEIKEEGNTLGGSFYVTAAGLPPGLGSYVHYDRRLDAKLAYALMSINAVKGVEIGIGFEAGERPGSDVQDEILKDDEGNIVRSTNRAGGIEAGVSNGLPVILRGVMKPIPTLMQPLKTVDLKTGSDELSHRERSDVTAVPACSIVAEAMTAWTIAEFFLEKFGGDSIEEIEDNYYNYIKRIEERLK